MAATAFMLNPLNFAAGAESSPAAHFVVSFLLVSLLFPIALMGVFRLSVERLWPITSPRKPGGGMNIAAFLFWCSTQVLLSPVMTLLANFVTNLYGGGLIALPSQGWGLAGGFLLYFLTMDLGDYLYHRAEHVFPWLWSMHSLHHSDTAFDSSTAVLHYWFSQLIRSLTVGVCLGLVFKAPPIDLFLYSLIGYHAYLMHSNVRLDFGRFAWVFTSPSYHRVHHSSLPEHFDCNYASMLPIFDVLFGTYRPARRGEWPPVGLEDGRVAKTLTDVLLWPIKGAAEPQPAKAAAELTPG